MQFQFKDTTNTNIYVLNPVGFSSSTNGSNGTDGPTIMVHFTPASNMNIKMTLSCTQNADIAAEGTFVRIKKVS